MTTPVADDELERAFPGCEPIHVLTLTSRAGLEGPRAVLDALAAAGARLRSLNMAECGGTLEQTLRFGAVTAREARRLADAVAALPSVLTARVEHQIMRAEAEHDGAGQRSPARRLTASGVDAP